MKKRPFPLPKKYRVYIALCLILYALIFADIFVVCGLEVEDFTQQDWCYTAIFSLTGVLFFFLASSFWKKASRIFDEQEKKYLDQFKYAEINPGDYDFIWFDFTGVERAKIVRSDGAYNLYVDFFDRETELWKPLDTVSVFSSLAELKEALFFEFDFYCEENAVIDRRGYEIFRDESNK